VFRGRAATSGGGEDGQVACAGASVFGTRTVRRGCGQRLAMTVFLCGRAATAGGSKDGLGAVAGPSACSTAARRGGLGPVSTLTVNAQAFLSARHIVSFGYALQRSEGANIALPLLSASNLSCQMVRTETQIRCHPM
jgi:hypothetical protein